MTTGQPTILQQILRSKRQEVEIRSAKRSLSELEAAFPPADQLRGFTAAMGARIRARKPAVIAEIKKASPSRGLIRADFDPVSLAQDYARSGATCLSILTDEQYFQGADVYLQQARASCGLPVLRKDFMLEPWQIAESRALGADCILLIVAALEPGRMRDLADYAEECGLDVLVEVHNEEELELALDLGTEMIGINNRDLHSFNTDIATSLRLARLVPSNRLLVTESGINSRAEVKKLLDAGIYGFLIGETLMRAPQPGGKLRELIGNHE